MYYRWGMEKRKKEQGVEEGSAESVGEPEAGARTPATLGAPEVEERKGWTDVGKD